MSIWIHLAIIGAIIGVAIILYECYDFLPQDFRDKLSGIKTKVIMVVAFFSPDVLAGIGTWIQGWDGIVPTTTINIAVKVIAALAFIARMQSFWDTRVDSKGQT